MLNNYSLEVTEEIYELTKKTVVENGSKLWEHNVGGRKNLYTDGMFCATTSQGDYLPLNRNITRQQFSSFLGVFKRNLYSQFSKNQNLYHINIEFQGISREKNYDVWNGMKVGQSYFVIDLNSAYWQMAHQLGYISKNLYQSYIDRDEYKEAKRYCISFLARTNHMRYLDGRKIDKVDCNVDCMVKVYDNIRNGLYNSIDKARSTITNWIEYNIDAVCVMEKDVPLISYAFDEMKLSYKIKEYVKTDELEFMTDRGLLRKF
jgi:predicted PolB exonuclease-like 3'-5' exonuclease